MELTTSVIRRELFVEQYLKNGLRARDAALAIGYSDTSAASAASLLLKDDYVQLCLKQRMDELKERNAITLDKVILRLWRILDFDMADIYDANGQLLPVQEMPLKARQALAGIKTEHIGPGVSVSDVKMPDRIRAATLLSQLLGFVEKDRSPGAPNAGDRTFIAEHVVRFEDHTEDITHEEVNLLPDAADTGQ